MDKIKLNNCFQIMKKMPPYKLEETNSNLSTLLNKNSETFREFTQKKEKPLSICKDDSLGEFIKSEFNNELDSFRSPWSNKYFPDVEIPKYPPNELRELEIMLNKLFKEYTKLYYGDFAVSSVYVWEQGDSIEKGFSCALCVKNIIIENRNLNLGEMDAINLVNITFFKEKEKNVERIKAIYKINSSVYYKMQISMNGLELSGNLTKSSEENHYLKSYLDYETHYEKIGKMVEFSENQIRNSIDEIYIKKTNEILKKLRESDSANSNRNTSINLVNLFNSR